MGRIYRAFVVACGCLLFATNASSSPDWLLARLQADGSISSPTDAATSVQSTAEALRTLRLLGRSYPSSSLPYLSAEEYRGTEYVSREITAAAEAGGVVALPLAELLSDQNSDCGSGELPGYASTALDTTFALDTVVAAGAANSTAVGTAVGYLLQAQKSDVGRDDHAAISDVYFTALVVRALQPLRDRVFAISSAIAHSNSCLLSRRGADASWSEECQQSSRLSIHGT